jgi:hypothetical protein
MLVRQLLAVGVWGEGGLIEGRAPEREVPGELTFIATMDPKTLPYAVPHQHGVPEGAESLTEQAPQAVLQVLPLVGALAYDL